MKLLRSRGYLPAIGLGLMFCVSNPLSLNAQGIGTGSGAGTGTGRESGGLGATGTGIESGGLGATSGNPFSQGRGPRSRDFAGPNEPLGDGANNSLGQAEALFAAEARDLLNEAKAINDPGERSRALMHLADTASFLSRPDLGHTPMLMAGEDAIRVPNDTIRDQRLMSVVRVALKLAEDQMKQVAHSLNSRVKNLEVFMQVLSAENVSKIRRDEAEKKITAKDAALKLDAEDVEAKKRLQLALVKLSTEVDIERIKIEAVAGSASEDEILKTKARETVSRINNFDAVQKERPIEVDRDANFNRSREEWQRAYELSFLIKNRSGRTEWLYLVAEREAEGASILVLNAFKDTTIKADPAKLPRSLLSFADSQLQIAIDHVATIERPTMRDRSSVAVAIKAAISGQFTRALQAARAIPQPEVRADALLKIAENQIIFGQQRAATRTYQETAQTISMVPNTDPRETLVGVLIDSLISFGRFEDARDCTVLYSNPANRPIALSTVARSQGRRGLGKSAREWIAQEPYEIRGLLYSKLVEGVLSAMEENASR